MKRYDEWRFDWWHVKHLLDIFDGQHVDTTHQEEISGCCEAEIDTDDGEEKRVKGYHDDSPAGDDGYTRFSSLQIYRYRGFGAGLKSNTADTEGYALDFILHTPGGLVLAAEQIALALKKHEAPVRILVPHYAMSGGTLLALSADEIIMDENAVLGPVDPQLGQYPAASIVKVVDEKNKNRIKDETLILADVSRKALKQVHEFVYDLVKDSMGEAGAEEIADTLTTGQWTHDYPITFEHARELGLPVKSGLPEETYTLMDLYPQPAGRRPSVEYIPVPYREEKRSGGKGSVW